MLYQFEMVKVSLEQALEALEEGERFSPESADFAMNLVKGAEEKKEEISQIIMSASRHWSLERMALIDKNILRIAVYELKYLNMIPFKVTINEAVELAKRFGDVGSSSFVNGVLDKISKEVGTEC
jgi:N utilization substance protein B